MRLKKACFFIKVSPSHTPGSAIKENSSEMIVSTDCSRMLEKN